MSNVIIEGLVVTVTVKFITRLNFATLLRLHFVLMAVTMFISMWMLNLTVVALMSPICIAILEQLEIVSCRHFQFRFFIEILQFT